VAKGRKTGGRQLGSLNQSTAEVKSLARVHGPDAVRLLADVMNNEKEPTPIRISTARQLLDRGYGKPAQPYGPYDGEPITVIIRRFADDPLEADAVLAPPH
jgi:hypothetical protein